MLCICKYFLNVAWFPTLENIHFQLPFSSSVSLSHVLPYYLALSQPPRSQRNEDLISSFCVKLLTGRETDKKDSETLDKR